MMKKGTMFAAAAAGLMGGVAALGVTVGVIAAPARGASQQDASGTGDQTMTGHLTDQTMLDHMRQVLDEDAYQRMLAHMATDMSGTPMTAGMMDGMVQSMTAPAPDAEGATPTAGAMHGQ